jgi:hypothetical protein
MKFYDSSHIKLSMLEPRLGGTRHKGEDSRAINQPVVFFTNAQDEIFSKEGIVVPFKYIVEIDENDPELFLDEKHYAFIQECKEVFPDLKDDTKWFFLRRPIKVLETLEWDGKKYVKR